MFETTENIKEVFEKTKFVTMIVKESLAEFNRKSVKLEFLINIFSKATLCDSEDERSVVVINMQFTKLMFVT